MEKLAIVIVGPTCSGKTLLAINLALKLQTEVISADSRQIYKHLTIGTAKPDKQDLEKVKHHFIDQLNPEVDFNASIFENESLQIIKSLHRQNKVPIIAGGSGLYIKALVDGIFDTVDTDDEYRAELLKLKNEFGNEHLYDLLKEVDPKSADTMLPQNWKRVMRALEVHKSAGKPIWEVQSDHKRKVEINFLQFGLNWNREILYENIELRVDSMIEKGLVEEVKSIISNYNSSLNSLNTVGYKEIIEYLENKISLERAVELIKRNTRRYAKRQMTWFRKDDRIKWFNINSSDDLKEIENSIFKQFKL